MVRQTTCTRPPAPSVPINRSFTFRPLKRRLLRKADEGPFLIHKWFYLSLAVSQTVTWLWVISMKVKHRCFHCFISDSDSHRIDFGCKWEFYVRLQKENVQSSGWNKDAVHESPVVEGIWTCPSHEKNLSPEMYVEAEDSHTHRSLNAIFSHFLLEVKLKIAPCWPGAVTLAWFFVKIHFVPMSFLMAMMLFQELIGR